MALLKLYAREEPAKDTILAKFIGAHNKKDTVFYKDKKATQLYARWAWCFSNRPTKRKTVTLNCYQWEIVWIN